MAAAAPTRRASTRLAEWIASRDNPLTARVIVNRIWHHHFGRGIVRTLDNLGRMGAAPTHPELLDWLAVEFMDRGWSIKEMHRLLMTSAAYRMASAHRHEASAAADPDNSLLWRYRPQRLDAEALRDAIMTVGGGVDLTVGGPPVFPHVPEEILRTSGGKGLWCGAPPDGRPVAVPHEGVWCVEPDGPAVWRRSVYVYRRRSLSFPFFETFDLPDQNQTAAARNVSTVSTQALTLMNNPFVLNQARLFAARLERAAPGDRERQVALAYRLALTRPPTAAEAAVAGQLAAEQGLVDLPPGQVTRSDGYTRFSKAARITMFQPHMHMLGKYQCLELIYPTQPVQTEVVNCAHFDYNWHLAYNYADDAAPLVPAGTILHVINWHDNTAGHRANPDPRNWTGSGGRTIDEMGFAWIGWYDLTDEEYEAELAEREAARRKTN